MSQSQLLDLNLQAAAKYRLKKKAEMKSIKTNLDVLESQIVHTMLSTGIAFESIKLAPADRGDILKDSAVVSKHLATSVVALKHEIAQKDSVMQQLASCLQTKEAVEIYNSEDVDFIQSQMASLSIRLSVVEQEKSYLEKMKLLCFGREEVSHLYNLQHCFICLLL